MIQGDLLIPSPPVSSTPLNQLSFVETVELLMHLGGPKDLEVRLMEFREFFDGSVLVHIETHEELKECCKLDGMLLPFIRSMFTKVNSYKESGVSNDLIAKLHQNRRRRELSPILETMSLSQLEKFFRSHDFPDKCLTITDYIDLIISKPNITKEHVLTFQKEEPHGDGGDIIHENDFRQKTNDNPPLEATNLDPAPSTPNVANLNLGSEEKGFISEETVNDQVLDTEDVNNEGENKEAEDVSSSAVITNEEPEKETDKIPPDLLKKDMLKETIVDSAVPEENSWFSCEKIIPFSIPNDVKISRTVLLTDNQILLVVNNGSVGSYGPIWTDIFLWNLLSNECEQTFRWDGLPLQAFTVFPDGKQFVAGAGDGGEGLVLLWDVKTGKYRIIGRHVEPISALTILPDGRIASGSNGYLQKSKFYGERHHDYGDEADFNVIKIWNYPMLQEKRNYKFEIIPTYILYGHTDRVRFLSSLPDGRLISGSDDHTVRIWAVTNIPSQYYFQSTELRKKGTLDKTERAFKSTMESFRLNSYPSQIIVSGKDPELQLLIVFESPDPYTHKSSIYIFDISTKKFSRRIELPLNESLYYSPIGVLPGSDLILMIQRVKNWFSPFSECLTTFDIKTGNCQILGNFKDCPATFVLSDGRLVIVKENQFQICNLSLLTK